LQLSYIVEDPVFDVILRKTHCIVAINARSDTKCNRGNL